MVKDHTANGIGLALIRQAQAGDAAAFGDLVECCRQRVFGTIVRLIGRLEDVEDVAQEVFLRLHSSIGQLRASEAFDLWLYRLTMNGAYDYLRKRPRVYEIRMADLGEQQVHLAAASASWQALRDERDRARTVELVDRLLANLSAADRVLIGLREVEQLSMQELSAVLGVSEGAVKVRLFRARQRLRQAIAPEAAKSRSPFASGATLAAQEA